MRLLIIAITLAASFSPTLLQAQETPGTTAKPAKEQTEKTAIPAVKSPAPYTLTVAKTYSGSTLSSSLVKIDTGKEFVGLTVPAKFQFKGSEDGREILVFLDEARQNWVKFKFYTNSVPEFTHQAVLPLISDNFSGAVPVFSTTYAAGKPVLGFTAKLGSNANPKQVRYQAVACQTGILMASTTVYEQETDLVFFKMKQLVTSLQFSKTEGELKRPPSPSAD